MLPFRSCLRMVLLVCLAVPAAAQSPAATENVENEVPVIVAIDTSRSLRPDELATAVGRLRAALEALPATTPTGLMAFEDATRWIRRPGSTPTAVAEALGELETKGNFTLLNDAVFVATRELPEGGVIVLATDGRDENSATTVDDIARRCEALDIRILAVGTGEPLAELALRRLALVSNGSYLGAVGSLDSAELTRAIDTARRDVESRRQPTPTAPPGSANPGTTAPASPEGSGDGTTPASGTSRPGGREAARWYDNPFLAAILVAALVLLGVWLWRRSQNATGSSGDSLEEIADDLDPDFQLQLAQRPTASLAEMPKASVDTAVFDHPIGEALEKTQVLANQGVLIVRRSGHEPRLYILGRDKAFSIGRSQQENTLAVPDPALSSTHFKIVPDDRKYYLLDLGSTNGTYLNGQRTAAKELASGDVLRAGQVEFEFQSQT